MWTDSVIIKLATYSDDLLSKSAINTNGSSVNDVSVMGFNNNRKISEL